MSSDLFLFHHSFTFTGLHAAYEYRLRLVRIMFRLGLVTFTSRSYLIDDSRSGPSWSFSS